MTGTMRENLITAMTLEGIQTITAELQKFVPFNSAEIITTDKCVDTTAMGSNAVLVSTRPTIRFTRSV